MGSWNAVCLTIPTDEPDTLAADIRDVFGTDWEALLDSDALPENVDIPDEDDIATDDFVVETFEGNVFCHGGNHKAASSELRGASNAFLDRSQPDFAVLTERFEDGQGACTAYYRFDTAPDFIRKRRDAPDGFGYVKGDHYEDWDSAYGAEHAANSLATEYDMTLVGVPKWNSMYVLEITRHKL